jgi:hypothetical protein
MLQARISQIIRASLILHITMMIETVYNCFSLNKSYFVKDFPLYTMLNFGLQNLHHIDPQFFICTYLILCITMMIHAIYNSTSINGSQ